MSVTARSAGRVFVVDDDAETRRLLHGLLLSGDYEIVEFPLIADLLSRIRTDSPDLVLLDLHLPDGNGHEVLEAIRSDPATRLLPVVMLTGLATKEEKLRATRGGATDFFAKPFAPEELLPRIRSLVQLKRFADEHEHAEHLILSLAKTIETRDPYTAGHSGRVAEYADQIAQRMGLDPILRIEMRRGALLHDLGKVVIPDRILHKQEPLTPEDRQVIEQHPVVGHELLAPMKTMAKMLPIVRSHHEKLDGSGYPDGLSGNEIPMTVRIVTVSDAFDALTHDRAYRTAFNLELAYEILYGGVQKSWWDPIVVEELRGFVSECGLIGEPSESDS